MREFVPVYHIMSSKCAIKVGTDENVQSLEGLRTFAKNISKYFPETTLKKYCPTFEVEEDFYLHLDNDENLLNFIGDFFVIREATKVYLTDFQ